MNDAFFTSTQQALKNITGVYDMIWPITVALWNLRCEVNGVFEEYPKVTESMLSNKFSVGSDIHGVNYKRAFKNTSWEEQKRNFAWMLLNNIFPIYEGWLECMKLDFDNINIKEFQYPQKIVNEINKLKNNRSIIMERAFYDIYSKRKYRNYNCINNWLYCFRFFKEMRNCYMHNGGYADGRLVNAYNDYLSHATCEKLDVKEVPMVFAPVEDKPIRVSLRGIVGFSFIIIKIMVSVDAELVCTLNAEREFIKRFKEKHKIIRTLKPDSDAAIRQVEHYVRQCGMPIPKNSNAVKTFLLNKKVISL